MIRFLVNSMKKYHFPTMEELENQIYFKKILNSHNLPMVVKVGDISNRHHIYSPTSMKIEELEKMKMIEFISSLKDIQNSVIFKDVKDKINSINISDIRFFTISDDDSDCVLLSYGGDVFLYVKLKEDGNISLQKFTFDISTFCDMTVEMFDYLSEKYKLF